MRRVPFALVLATACGGLTIPRDEIVRCDSGGGCPDGMICTQGQICWDPPARPPLPPSDATVEYFSGGFELRWTPVKDATSYNIFFATRDSAEKPFGTPVLRGISQTGSF